MKKQTPAITLTDLINEVVDMDPDELYDIHGIEILDDGTVYDFIEGINYDNVKSWATVQIAMTAKIEKRRSSKYEDDEE